MNELKQWLCVLVLIAASVDLTAQALAERPLLTWVVEVEDADLHPVQARHVRLYSQPESVQLRLTMFNESNSSIAVDQGAFHNAVNVTVKNMETAEDTAVQTSWVGLRLRLSDDGPLLDVGTSEAGFVLPAKRGAVWTFRVQPEAGQFELGEYRFDVSLANIRDALGTDANERWNGRYHQQTDVTVIIRPPAASPERSAMVRLSARIASQRGDFAEALRLLSRANQDDPSDLSTLAALGQVYMFLDKYKEAAAAYEQLLPRLSQRNAIASMLALAYLSLNDEANAARVLRMTGMSEDVERSELASLREAVQRRRTR
jgi:tetratricopeptide (TPR) repeat protein